MNPNTTTRIALVAGPVRPEGRAGHHDYAAGCALLADLLTRIVGVTPFIVHDGWPRDESVFEEAAAIVFYDNGGGRQAFLQSPARRAILQAASSRGCGLVMLHQTIGFPAADAAFGQTLVGGVYVAGDSRRGHCKSRHDTFPDHPICRGVVGWSARDGWLRSIRFAANRRYVTPLVWAGDRGPRRDQDIVCWAHEAPERGRGFVFTGLDNHSAWRQAGLRRLIANGVLWSAGMDVPGDPEWTDLDTAAIAAYQTPRRLPARRFLRALGHRMKRARNRRRQW